MNRTMTDDEESDYPNYEPFASWTYELERDTYDPIWNIQDGKKICVRKVKHGEKYKKCNKELVCCDHCRNQLCPSLTCIPQYMIRISGRVTPSKEHDKCIYCDTGITCCMSGVCGTCEKNHQYDMITEDVAIGSYQASYEPFDLIVNLDYPYNHVKLNEVSYKIENNKHIIRCGYEDGTYAGWTSEKLEHILEMIKDTNKKKILFHCYAGVSRSSTLEIAYLARCENKTTAEMYEFVKQKRPRINPNSHFRILLGLDNVVER